VKFNGNIYDDYEIEQYQNKMANDEEFISNIRSVYNMYVDNEALNKE
jgi:hypothetical protein